MITLTISKNQLKPFHYTSLHPFPFHACERRNALFPSVIQQLMPTATIKKAPNHNLKPPSLAMNASNTNKRPKLISSQGCRNQQLLLKSYADTINTSILESATSAEILCRYN
ncbi:Os08g0225050 [Oryza sativa Japonica Group]|uniref:Os08g0225050 protein n=1 Tax=Oryza sativa subsp. japonica TaxID=39947 RepID=A0A0N7KPH0_ORYSJ|nr:hypothetical protein EE612_042840 [Oryza sativa]BAT04394.1 Os08g0225050 [Oryza sativa Japonica Group]